jgi:dUTP pyrophosphatase
MKVQIINDSKFELPEYKTEKSAGLDLRVDFSKGVKGIAISCGDVIYNANKIYIHPNTRCILPTMLKIQLPDGYEATVRPRSGISFNSWLDVKLGTIDSDYTGYIGVIVWNRSNEVIVVENGDRIAQLVISKIGQAEFEEVDVLEQTERGNGGFGSTGIK